MLTQYKSFSKLARELPLSQSTISHQISQLEKDFGGVLIDRSTKKFELTKAGTLLLKNATQIIDLYDNCKLEISKLVDQYSEEIVISASTTPGSHILPRHIAVFRSQNPNLNFNRFYWGAVSNAALYPEQRTYLQLPVWARPHGL